MKKLIAIAMLGASVLSSCTKDDGSDKPGREYQTPFKTISPEIIKQNTIVLDKSYDVDIPSEVVFEQYGASLSIPHMSADNFLDLHLEILPIYVFGEEMDGGDFYAVKGYIVAHNASMYKYQQIVADNQHKDVTDFWGWYMGQIAMDCQLLDKDGNAVNNEKVRFLVTPEPSTTIGVTTYKKGFSFSLSPKLTFGFGKVEEPGAEPSWKTTLLGAVSLGFNWEESSTQKLPNQVVNMSTDPYNRSVNHKVITHNDRAEAGEDAIPSEFKTDQRFDFSWVWHVTGGSYSAKDNGFDGMKMKVDVTTTHKYNHRAIVWAKSSAKSDTEDRQYSAGKYGATHQCKQDSWNIDIPAMNRIPVGTFKFKNCTRNYVRVLGVWRHNEYGLKQTPYLSVSGVYDTNDSVSALLREGEYDLIYEIVNGDTGEVIGRFKVESLKITAAQTIELTTLDGKRI